MAGYQDVSFEIDGETHDLWKELPWFLYYFVAYVCYYRHMGAWKYLPSTMAGVRQPLYATQYART